MPFPRSGRALQSLSAATMSALLLASAMKHFRDPRFYRQVVPDYLCLEGRDNGTEPDRRRPFAVMTREEWIAVSGLLELAAAAGILVPPARRATATALTAMFAVFVAGHVDAIRRAYGPEGTRAQRKVHTLRLPLQAPLILWAWSLRKPAPKVSGHVPGAWA
ncbi:DoxX family protein [Pseudarthrobacter siccitolerans]